VTRHAMAAARRIMEAMVTKDLETVRRASYKSVISVRL